MLTFRFSGKCGKMEVPEKLVAGTIGKQVLFEFSSDWSNLKKTAVFMALDGSSHTACSVEVTQELLTIPAAVLANPEHTLYVQVQGYSAEGAEVINTGRIKGPRIMPGIDSEALPELDAKNPVWFDVLTQIGDIDTLETDSKVSLVSAINELAQSKGLSEIFQVVLWLDDKDRYRANTSYMEIAHAHASGMLVLLKYGVHITHTLAGSPTENSFLFEPLLHSVNGMPGYIVDIQDNWSAAPLTRDEVLISDIVDDLETNANDQPLSAAQGVVLKGLYDTLKGTVDDLNHEGNEILIYGYADDTQVYNAVLNGRPVYCLYEHLYYLPLVSWDENTHTAVFGGCYDNQTITCKAEAGEWSIGIADVSEPEIFVGTEDTTVEIFNIAFASGKPCFLRKANAGEGIIMWVAYTCNSSNAKFYRVTTNGSIQHGVLSGDGTFSYETVEDEREVFIGDENTSVTEFYEAFMVNQQPCFMLRNSGGTGLTMWVAYTCNQNNAQFYRITGSGGIQYGMLKNDNTFESSGVAVAKFVGEESTDDQIPTATAVYHALLAKQDAVPQAVVDGASALVTKALTRGDENVLRFAIYSDAHQHNGNADITAGNKELGMAIGEVINRMGVDFVSCLGDSAWGAYADPTGEVQEQLKTFNSFIQSHIRGEQQLNVEGNHDDAHYSTVDSDGDGVASSTQKLSLAETYSLVYAKNKDVVYDPAHAIDGYCYKDFGHIKTRVICLNTEQGTTDGGVMEGYQLKWFAETALNMEGKAGWNVVTLAHHPLDYPILTLFRDAVTIVDTFIKGTNLSFTTNDGTAIAVNYSGKSCQYVGHFHGHTHSFSIVRLNKYDSATDTSNYTELNAWQIGIPNACYTRSNEHLNKPGTRLSRYSTPTTYQKSAIDGKRTSFNLVSVDLDNQTIYADNYGAGIDRQVSYAFTATVYTIQNSLTNCVSSNSSTSIEENGSYSATITPNDGYTMSAITVTMGGSDITASAVNGREISIGNVTGNIVITAAAEIEVERYTNQIPIAKDTDGSVYNGKGWKENTRIETSGATGTKSGQSATGFIPLGCGSANAARGEQVVYMANIDAALDANFRIGFYKSDKSFIGLEYGQNLKDAAADPGGSVSLYTKGADGYINKADFTGLTSYYKNAGKGEVAYIRISSPGLDGASIIAVNEPIR